MNGRINPGGQGQGKPPGPSFNWTLIFWLLILFFLIGPWISKQFVNKGTEISYSTFRHQLEAGNVEKVTVQGEKISGEFRKPAEKKNPGGKPVPYKEFFTYLPSFGDERLLPILEAQKVDIVTEPRKDVSFWGEILAGMLPFLILIGLGVFFLRKRGLGGGQGLFSFAGSRARLYERRKESTTFKDAAGAHGAKIELQEIIEFLKDPARIQRLGGKAPKGVLLVGPQGQARRCWPGQWPVKRECPS